LGAMARHRRKRRRNVEPDTDGLTHELIADA
jgi:hypothetical protein